MQRRSLDFRDADAVIAEIRALQSGGYEMLGKWNLAQMCDHLRATLLVGLEGSERRLPSVVRALVTNPLFRHVIKTRRMKSGLPTTKELAPTSPSGPDDPAAIDACIATIERARDAAGPLPPHPMVDLTPDEWKQLNWVHAAHHLGFLIPKHPPVEATPPGEDAASGPP